MSNLPKSGCQFNRIDRLRDKFGPMRDCRCRPARVLGRECASSSLTFPSLLAFDDTRLAASSPSSSVSSCTPSSSSSSVRVIDDVCEAISSPCKFLFFKLPIQKTDEQLLAARAPFTLKTSCSTVSRTVGICAMMMVFLISLCNERRKYKCFKLNCV